MGDYRKDAGERDNAQACVYVERGNWCGAGGGSVLSLPTGVDIRFQGFRSTMEGKKLKAEVLSLARKLPAPRSISWPSPLAPCPRLTQPGSRVWSLMQKRRSTQSPGRDTPGRLSRGPWDQPVHLASEQQHKVVLHQPTVRKGGGSSIRGNSTSLCAHTGASACQQEIGCQIQQKCLLGVSMRNPTCLGPGPPPHPALSPPSFWQVQAPVGLGLHFSPLQPL